jgi:hypothetical protein
VQADQATASESEWWRSSAGSCRPAVVFHSSSERWANISITRSPAATGKVTRKPFAPGKTTGTSTSLGGLMAPSEPSCAGARSVSSGTTVAVCLVAS